MLVYLLFSCFFMDRSSKGISDSISETSQTDFDFAQKSLNSSNIDFILNHNIFNTYDTSQKSSQKQPLVFQTVNIPSKNHLDLRLLGTVAGDGTIGCAIIENIITKVQDLYNVGDIVDGARIEKIERNRIILLNDGFQEILNLYVASDDKGEPVLAAKEEITTVSDKTPEVPDVEVIKVTSPTERQVNKSAFLSKIGGIEAVLKTVAVTPHTDNGKSDGLQITGLEGLGMAKFVGLENGDIIRVINGQVVTDNRKAFQVLRKARSLSSLDMELSRGSEKKVLSFKID